jgi:aspartate kinase
MGAELIVQKYGGTSLGTPARIRDIAVSIAHRASEGTRVVVTVSAMGKTTDDLLALAHEVTHTPTQRELDMLLTVGERISMALLSMALNEAGCPAISFTGSQSGIVTNISHNRAMIEEIRGDRIREELDRDRVVIVAGFQGVSREREITTLGRGGSDTTAVALASALGAVNCEIYSDVAGVFTADPRWVTSARLVPAIHYDEMLELAALGATVLHYRAAELARRYRVPLRLASSFGDNGETIVSDTAMEKPTVTSVTCNEDIIVLRVDGNSGACRNLLGHIANADVRLTHYQKESSGSATTITVIVGGEDAGVVERAAGECGLTVTRADDLATVSLVGSGVAGNAALVLDVEESLASNNISVSHTETSAMSVTCLVPRADCRRAVEALHAAFLNKK